MGKKRATKAATKATACECDACRELKDEVVHTAEVRAMQLKDEFGDAPVALDADEAFAGDFDAFGWPACTRRVYVAAFRAYAESLRAS